MARASKRNLVTEVAQALFLRQGFHATGINQITQEAGIASMTLYNNFRSKDDLVLHVLEKIRTETLLELQMEVSDQASLERKIDAIFSWLHLKAQESSVAAPLHAASEYRDGVHPVSQLIQRYHDDLRELLCGFCQPEQAGQILVLIHGAIASTVITHNLEAFIHAKAAAVQLVDEVALCK